MGFTNDTPSNPDSWFGTAWVVPKAPATSWHKGKRPNWAQHMKIQCTKGVAFFPWIFVVQKMVCFCYKTYFDLIQLKKWVKISSILQNISTKGVREKKLTTDSSLCGQYAWVTSEPLKGTWHAIYYPRLPECRTWANNRGLVAGWNCAPENPR